MRVLVKFSASSHLSVNFSVRFSVSRTVQVSFFSDPRSQLTVKQRFIPQLTDKILTNCQISVKPHPYAPKSCLYMLSSG